MEFQEVVRRRRMVRRYADRPVEPEAIDRVLANAQRAPSAGFSQGWAFLLLDTPGDVGLFWDTTTGETTVPNRWLDGMRTAPVVIVPMADKGAYLDRYAEPDKGWTDRDETRWPIPFWYTDTAMASMLILQTAVDEGLGACFFGITPGTVAEFRAAFDVPEELMPIGAITVGHRARDAGTPGSPARRERRTDVVHRGRYRGRSQGQSRGQSQE